jgi:hypothetical protein
VGIPHFFENRYTDINNPKKPRVWRLLLERDTWIYLFPALTKEQQKDPKARPPVIAVQQIEILTVSSATAILDASSGSATEVV